MDFAHVNAVLTECVQEYLAVIEVRACCEHDDFVARGDILLELADHAGYGPGLGIKLPGITERSKIKFFARLQMIVREIVAVELLDDLAAPDHVDPGVRVDQGVIDVKYDQFRVGEIAGSHAVSLQWQPHQYALAHEQGAQGADNDAAPEQVHAHC